jgi:hypothetical protein
MLLERIPSASLMITCCSCSHHACSWRELLQPSWEVTHAAGKSNATQQAADSTQLCSAPNVYGSMQINQHVSAPPGTMQLMQV